MYVNKIKLINFRNYPEAEAEFINGINILYGYNAQGKTNILEAIYLSALGKSLRMARDSEMILFGSEGYFIEIDLIKKDRSYKIEIGVNNKKEKRIKISGKEIRKTREILGKLIVVLFSPDELKIIKESPHYRRRFLDILICQLNPSYLLNLQKYYKIAGQRNNLLKQIKKKKELEETLDIWNQEYAQTAVFIIKKRIEYLERLKEKTAKIHYKLTEGKEKNEIIYKPTFKQAINNKDFSVEKFLVELKQTKEIDIETGFTHIGPHRDDIIININGKGADRYGSQGQQRTAVLSLKLAEMEVIKEEIGENPVLILDDVFSELDIKRRQYLMEYLKGVQVFITCTGKDEEGSLIEDIKYYRINNGRIEY